MPISANQSKEAAAQTSPVPKADGVRGHKRRILRPSQIERETRMAHKAADPTVDVRVLAEVVAHPDPTARAQTGRDMRGKVPRSAHAEWNASVARKAPADILAEQEVSRVPELISIRHERMNASPFAFYRGAAAVMASDLSLVPRTDLLVQCCGDAHLANFGGFASPERDLVFDINDFDETSVGPFEWDVKRLAASFEIACRAREFSRKETRAIVLATAQSYRDAMRNFAMMHNLDVWYSRINANEIRERFGSQASGRARRRFDALVAKAETKDSMKAFSKLTTVVDGEPRIVNDPPLIVRLEDLAGESAADAAQAKEFLHLYFREYRHSLQGDRRRLIEGYRLVDIARKVVGVGSVGTRCWIALLLGRDNDDPLFLQFKEATTSVLEPYCGKSGYASSAQRVVEGQRLLQASSDILLGWVRLEFGLLDGLEHDYYARQLWDWKVSVDLETMPPENMLAYAHLTGWSLARGHARSGDRIAIGAYLGSGDVFDRAISDFAIAYADQNEHDYEAVAKTG
jgi:uncharacterized protein (DUF2252 family)